MKALLKTWIAVFAAVIGLACGGMEDEQGRRAPEL